MTKEKENSDDDLLADSYLEITDGGDEDIPSIEEEPDSQAKKNLTCRAKLEERMAEKQLQQELGDDYDYFDLE